jgi:hypothetical protein
LKESDEEVEEAEDSEDDYFDTPRAEFLIKMADLPIDDLKQNILRINDDKSS